MISQAPNLSQVCAVEQGGQQLGQALLALADHDHVKPHAEDLARVAAGVRAARDEGYVVHTLGRQVISYSSHLSQDLRRFRGGEGMCHHDLIIMLGQRLNLIAQADLGPQQVDVQTVKTPVRLKGPDQDRDSLLIRVFEYEGKSVL